MPSPQVKPTPTKLVSALAAGRRPGLPPRTAELALSRFDTLPNAAAVPKRTACAVLSMSIAAFTRASMVDPRLKPIRINARVVRYRVDGIRSILRGEEAQSDARKK